MTLVLKIDGVTVVGRVKMGEVSGLPTAAWYAEPMTGGLIIEDRDATLDLQGWHYFTADEDDCAVGGTRLFTGWITGTRAKRGNEHDGVARVWDVDILEANGLWGLEVLRGGDAKRPAETDVDRISWLITANAMDDTPVQDFGRFSTAGPINMGEGDFVGSFPMDVATPTGAVAGKNIYAYWSDDDGALGIHYDLTANGPSASVAVSNDMADVDGVDTFYPLLDGELERDPSEKATGIFLRWRNGTSYGENLALEAELSPTEISPGAFKRDQVIDSDRIGNSTTAANYVTRFLGQRDRDKEILRFTVRLPATKVNAIHAGDVLSVKFTHLPNLDPAANRVVTRRNVFQSPGRRDSYDLVLECADYELVAPGGGDVGELPNPPCTPQLVQVQTGRVGASTSDATWNPIPTDGNLLVMWVGVRGNAAGQEYNPTGWTALHTGWAYDPSGTKHIGVRMFYKIASSESATPTFTTVGSPDPVVAMAEFTSVDTLDDFNYNDAVVNQPTIAGDPMFFAAGPVTPTTGGRPVLFVGGIMSSNNPNDNPWAPVDEEGGITLYTTGYKATAGTANSDLKSWFGYKAGSGGTTPAAETFAPANLSSGGVSRGYLGLMAAFSGDPCAGACPQTGQWSPWQFVAEGDGTTTNFFTDCPYADLSLRVRVDNVEIMIGLTEVDGATGEFSLDFAPKAAQGDAPAEQVWVTYQGR